MTDKTFCDVCGKEIKAPRTPLVEIHMPLDWKKHLPLSYDIHKHRLRKRCMLTIDLCSWKCFLKVLDDVKEGAMSV
jgi:hypothetical protein